MGDNLLDLIDQAIVPPEFTKVNFATISKVLKLLAKVSGGQERISNTMSSSGDDTKNETETKNQEGKNEEAKNEEARSEEARNEEARNEEARKSEDGATTKSETSSKQEIRSGSMEKDQSLKEGGHSPGASSMKNVKESHSAEGGHTAQSLSSNEKADCRCQMNEERFTNLEKIMYSMAKKLGINLPRNEDLECSCSQDLPDIGKEVEKKVDSLEKTCDICTPLGSDTNVKDPISKLSNELQNLEQNVCQLQNTQTNLVCKLRSKDDENMCLIEELAAMKSRPCDPCDDIMPSRRDNRSFDTKTCAALDMIASNLEEKMEYALNKLHKQDELWQVVLDDIQREIHCKLDKTDMCELRKTITGRLEDLKTKLMNMETKKALVEALGAKKQLIKDLNCMSCDRPVVMSSTAVREGRQNGFPGRGNMRPYLSYELDAMRKSLMGADRRDAPPWMNMENDCRRDNQRYQEYEDNAHICTRYCGGSHTRTSPMQRVARASHFQEQWGLDVAGVGVCKPPTRLRGQDGRYYFGGAEKKEAPKSPPPCAIPKPKPSPPAKDKDACLCHEEIPKKPSPVKPPEKEVCFCKPEEKK